MRVKAGGAVLGIAIAFVILAASQAVGTAADTAPWIIFSAHPNGSGDAQLFRVQTTGEGLQQITTGRFPATSPAFAPNGNSIAFTRLGSGIFSVNLDGTGLHRLTSGRRDSSPVYSRDGKRIAFLRPFKTGWRLYVMSATGAGKRPLPHAPPAGRPTWSKDGKSIFIPAAGDLYRVDSRTGKALKVYGLALDIQTAQTATLSPNYRTIAYLGPRVSTGPPDCGEGPCPQYGLYLANLGKPHHPRRIVNDTGPAGWAPDGKTLVFVSRGALALHDFATGKRTAVATGPNVAAGDAPPAWQPS